MPKKELIANKRSSETYGDVYSGITGEKKVVVEQIKRFSFKQIRLWFKTIWRFIG